MWNGCSRPCWRAEPNSAWPSMAMPTAPSSSPPAARSSTAMHVLLIAARALKAAGHLAGDLVVSTVMSNLGLERALAAEGIRMLRTPVGDKYVLEEMVRRGAVAGRRAVRTHHLPRIRHHRRRDADRAAHFRNRAREPARASTN